MWQNVWMALGLVLVLEGIVPFLTPENYKKWLSALSQLSEKSLRIMGAASMAVGVIIVITCHNIL